MSRVSAGVGTVRAVGAVLARGHLRHLAARGETTTNLSCFPTDAAPGNAQNCLDVAGPAKHELDGNRPLRRPRCKLV